MKAVSVGSETVRVGAKVYPQIRLYADSAIGRDVMPLFVPDIPLVWKCRVCLALRISRLGKNIAEKFALRYIDGISLIALLYPTGNSDEAVRFVHDGCLSVLDSALTTGTWLQADAVQESLEMTVGDVSKCYKVSDLEIGRQINMISRLATIKSGDILILENTAIDSPLVVNTYIKASLNGTPCLSVKVK